MTDSSDAGVKGFAMYHEMRGTDCFEETAGILWAMVRAASRLAPGQPRRLYVDIEGHSEGGGYDAEAQELIAFMRAAIGPHVTEVSRWGRTDDTAPQREDMPESLVMCAGPDDPDQRVVILTGDMDEPVRRG